MRITMDATYVRGSGTLTLETYVDGTPALVFQYDDGPDTERLSVNLSQYGLVPPKGHVYVPTWSEHEGVADSLVGNGVGTIVGWAEVGSFGSRAVLLLLSEYMH